MITAVRVLCCTILLSAFSYRAAAGNFTNAVLAGAPRKPGTTVLRPGQEAHRIAVKFREGLNVRLRNGALVSTNAELFANSRVLFASLSAGRWQRADAVSEETIDQLRHRAEQRLGRALPDLNLQFYLTLPASMDAGAVIDRLNQLDIVELAQPVPHCAPPPEPPDYQREQVYNNSSPTGEGVFNVWTGYGVFGAGVQVADVEYSFNSNHLDLPAIVNLTPDAIDPFNSTDHGTATLGEVSALENGWGTTGIAYNSSFFFAGANYPDGYDVGAGISTAAAQLQEGDVLLVEQQTYGPNVTQYSSDNGGQFGLVPVDWYQPYYDRVAMAVGLGIIVVEAAGNGGQNLDDPIYQAGNGVTSPFMPQNSSGALIVGAGASLSGSSTESSRLDFSNFGSRLDLQGWGENIVTTGYGDLYDAEGPNLYYTSSFGGTSGATPTVVGEAALLQSIYENATGQPLTPSQMGMLLRNTAKKQAGGAYTPFENIGPLPNLPLAVSVALSNSGPPVIVMSSTNVTAVIGGTAALSVATAGAQPMTYQWQLNQTALQDDANLFGSASADLILNNLTAQESGSYSVLASNASGTASATVNLSVISDPALTEGVTLSNFYTFSGEDDGDGPVGLTPDGFGDLYGMTEYGGTNGTGVIFAFTPATLSLYVLYTFTNGIDGGYPAAPLLPGSDGNFYGLTQGGAYNSGTIFYITPYGEFNPLYTLTGENDGGTPYGGLIEVSNVFYGTAYYGGSSGDYGVIFTVDSSGDFNVIHNFDFVNGGGPNGGLALAADGNLYGMTDYGGAGNDGIIYRISPGGTFSNLFSFNGANGSGPSDSLVQGLDGKLYGRAYGGGGEDLGTVFSMTTNGGFQLLFSFDGTNGANPQPALLAGNDGNLYGVTENGGTNDQDGVIYEIAPSGAFAIVARFDGLKGINPYAPMARGDDGNFYGTTFAGGYGSGVIFQLSFTSTPQPSFQTVIRTNDEIRLAWNAVPGRSYQVQFTTNLSLPDWTALAAPENATNGISSTTDSLPSFGQKFYRMKLALP